MDSAFAANARTTAFRAKADTCLAGGIQQGKRFAAYQAYAHRLKFNREAQKLFLDKCLV